MSAPKIFSENNRIFEVVEVREVSLDDIDERIAATQSAVADFQNRLVNLTELRNKVEQLGNDIGVGVVEAAAPVDEPSAAVAAAPAEAETAPAPVEQPAEVAPEPAPVETAAPVEQPAEAPADPQPETADLPPIAA